LSDISVPSLAALKGDARVCGEALLLFPGTETPSTKVFLRFAKLEKERSTQSDLFGAFCREKNDVRVPLNDFYGSTNGKSETTCGVCN
jgi:hypothetical protein